MSSPASRSSSSPPPPGDERRDRFTGLAEEPLRWKTHPNDVIGFAVPETCLAAAKQSQRLQRLSRARCRKRVNLALIAAHRLDLRVDELGDVDHPARREIGLDVRRV